MNTQTTDSPLHTGTRHYKTPSFQGVYERYGLKIYAHCLSFTKDHDLAQDFTQDIFLRLFDKLHTFQGRAHITTWLHSITVNYCLDELKRARRLPLESLSHQQERFAVEEPYEEFDEQLAWRVYQQLPTGTQQLLRLKYEQGLSLLELSRQLNCSVPSLKMRLKRGKHQALSAYQRYLDI